MVDVTVTDGDGGTGSQNYTLTVKAKTIAGVIVTSLPLSYYGQEVTFTATFTATPAGSASMTGMVAFYDGQTYMGTEPLIASGDPSGTSSLSTSSLAVGSHVITAIYSGDASFSAATVEEPVSLEVITTVGPQVTKVVRYGFHTQPTYLLVSFNGPLEPKSAQNPLNYQILGPGGHRVKIASAIYDSATDTVTLVPAERLNIHRTYRLTVKGTTPSGLTNPSGIPLDGSANGKPGSDYVTSLTWRNLAGRASKLPTLGLVDAARARSATKQLSTRDARAKLHEAAIDVIMTESSHLRWGHRATRSK